MVRPSHKPSSGPPDASRAPHHSRWSCRRCRAGWKQCSRRWRPRRPRRRRRPCRPCTDRPNPCSTWWRSLQSRSAGFSLWLGSTRGGSVCGSWPPADGWSEPAWPAAHRSQSRTGTPCRRSWPQGTGKRTRCRRWKRCQTCKPCRCRRRPCSGPWRTLRAAAQGGMQPSDVPQQGMMYRQKAKLYTKWALTAAESLYRVS